MTLYTVIDFVYPCQCDHYSLIKPVQLNILEKHVEGKPHYIIYIAEVIL